MNNGSNHKGKKNDAMKLKSKETTEKPEDWSSRMAVLHEDIAARKLAEEKLRQSEERYRVFVEQSSEAIWRLELSEPLNPAIPMDEQIEHFYRHAYLAECNNAMARMYGYERNEEIIGATLGDLLPRSDPANIDYLRNAIQSGYRLTDAESHELDRDGNSKYFLNNLIGIIEGEGENARLLRAWGTQRDITEQKQTEAALRQSEQKLRMALDAAGLGIWEWMQDGGRRVSENYAQVVGAAPLTAEGFLELVHPDDRAGLSEKVQQALKGSGIYQHEYRVIPPDGKERWVAGYGRVISRDGLQPDHMMGVVMNITERQRAEEALRASEHQLRLVTDNVPVFIVYCDTDRRYRFVNKVYADRFGMRPEEILGKRIAEIVGEDAYAVFHRYVDIVLAGEAVEFEVEVPYNDIGQHYVHGAYVPDVDLSGEVRGFYALISDITERKQAEELLRQSEARYRQLADAMPQLVWTCGADGVVDYYNSRLADYVEVVQTADGRWQWQPILHPDDVAPTLARWKRAMETGEPYEFEHRLKMHDGRYCWHLSRARAGYDADGRIVRWFGTATDIDSNKRIELNAQFLVELDAHLNRITTPEEIEQAAITRLGQYLNVERCYFGIIANNQAVVEREWRRGGPPLAGKYNLTEYFTPEAMAHLRVSGAIAVNDVMNDSRIIADTANYAALELGAFITTGVTYQSRWIGALNAVSRMPRQWHKDEIELLREVAARVWPLIERARAIAAMQDSETRFRSLADSVPQIIWVTNADGTLEFINARWIEYTGMDLAKSLLDANRGVHPDDLNRAISAWRESQQTGKPYEMEMRLRRADGVYRWFLARSVPLCDASGSVTRWFGTSTDIHEQKQIEADTRLLAEIGERIRLAEDASALLWEVTKAMGGHLQVAHCFFTEVQTGQDSFLIHRDYYTGPRSFEGSYSRSAFGPALVAELMAGRVVVVRDTAADPRVTDSVDSFKQNGIGAIVAVPLLRDDRQVSSLIVTSTEPREWTLHEVTLLETVAERTWLAVEKLRLDAQAHSANERFERAESAAHGYVFEWDVISGNVVRSRNFTGVLGYDLDEVPPTVEGWIALIHPDDQTARRQQTAAIFNGSAANYSGEYRVRHKAGHYVWVFEQGIIERDQTGQPMRLVGTTIDITPRKQAEDQISHLLKDEQTARAEAERATRLKDEFLGLVSHELRSPLNAISGWIKLLRGGRLTPADTAKALATIERNAVAQNHLIEDLLDVSRVVAGKLKLEPQVIDPHIAIEAAFDTARPTAEAKGIRLELHSAPLGIALRADPNRLQQAVWNLLSNAIKFTPAGGQVSVELARANNHVEIKVTDTGIGIEPEFLPYVFERFRQADATSSRKYGGLGLGLAIVRHIVELHGGEVEAASKGDGQGAVFIIKLPLATSAQGTEEQPVVSSLTLELPAATAAHLVGLRVLAIDDEEADREMLKAILNNYGLQVKTVGSAAEGLEALLRNQFDAIVCDIAMPGGDGYEFIRQVREQEEGSGQRLPAIALTAYARGEDRVRTLGAGFDSHVSKPVEPVELAIVLATLAERLGR